MDQINERLIRIENDISTIKGKVAQLEDGLNYTKSELAEMKGKLEEKVEKDLLKDLEREVEDLRNRSRRNNLVFYNIPEKAEGQDCAAFIKGFITDYFMNHTFSFVIQHPLFNLHTSLIFNEGFICINPSFQGFYCSPFLT